MKIGPRSGTGTRASADPTRRKQAPRQTEDYRLETLDGELLLYHPAQTKTLYLNETASLVWNLCNGERTSDEICAILREAFPDASDVDADVESTLESLLHSRAITYGGKRSTRPGPVLTPVLTPARPRFHTVTIEKRARAGEPSLAHRFAGSEGVAPETTPATPQR